MGGNIPGGNFLGGNFPGGNFPEGSLMGGNFPGGSSPDTPFILLFRKNISHIHFYIWASCNLFHFKLFCLLNYLKSIYTYHIVTSHMLCHSDLLVSLWKEHWFQLINPFQINYPFLYPLKTPGKKRFSDVFTRYRNEALAWNRLKSSSPRQKCLQWQSNLRPVQHLRMSLQTHIFMAIVKDCKTLAAVTKSPILDVAGVVDHVSSVMET